MHTHTHTHSLEMCCALAHYKEIPAYFYTVVADAAVGAARRAVELAGIAPLHLHLHTVDIDHPVEGLPEVILFVCILCE